MIGVTDAAKKELKRILRQNTEDPEAVLRLTATPEGELGLIMDLVEEGDDVFKHEGDNVLVVDKRLGDALTGMDMDVEETQEGPVLTFRGSCGCGGDSGCGAGPCC